jgi:ribosomal protein L7Ae-like RNA K-turn-binding protein
MHFVQCRVSREASVNFAYISIEVDTSPSTKTLNFLCERKEIRYHQMVENPTLGNVCVKLV